MLHTFFFFFFYFETGGFAFDKDVLQITLKNENNFFSVYITPCKNIDAKASAVTGLTKSGRQLFLHGTQVQKISRRVAVTKILEFFKSFNKKIVLIAHNCEFDSNHENA